MAKTTPEHFSIFKKGCLHWIDEFGLKDWKITFRQMDIESDDPEEAASDDVVTGAGCVADFRNRVAALILQADWKDIKPTNQMVRAVAFHEVCHVLLWGLVHLGQQRSASERDIRTEAHAVIRRLENAVFNVK